MLSVADFTLQQAGCRLRPVCAADASVLVAIYTDARTQQFVGQLLTDADAIDRIAACAEANQQPQRQKFYLALENPQQQLAGMLAVFNIEPALGLLELGIMLLPGRQQPGLARTAYSALIERAFALGFFQVFASMQPQNLAALRLVRQCGMRQCDMVQCDMVQCSAKPAEVRYQISRPSN
ncbi:MAG: N-acetyltransferase [Rheinheimera sp.]|nr:MAG: N-acetyltransferase [Rheinheimera sp.]